jgi:uncharacterized protein involved in tellurium resistance
MVFSTSSKMVQRSVVQALGDSFGSLGGNPWIVLDRGDRTGATLRARYDNAVHHFDKLGVIVYSGA